MSRYYCHEFSRHSPPPRFGVHLVHTPQARRHGGAVGSFVALGPRAGAAPAAARRSELTLRHRAAAAGVAASQWRRAAPALAVGSPMARREVPRPLEGAAEGLLGVVADPPPDHGDREVRGRQELLGQVDAPLGQVSDRRPAEEPAEPLVEPRAGHGGFARQRRDGPPPVRPRVESSECGGDDRIAQRGESCAGPAQDVTVQVGGTCDTQMRPVSGVH